jgi:hypothetical protein
MSQRTLHSEVKFTGFTSRTQNIFNSSKEMGLSITYQAICCEQIPLFLRQPFFIGAVHIAFSNRSQSSRTFCCCVQAFRAATMASPISMVLAFPRRSPVRIPESKTFRTASSILLASASMSKEYRNIMATQRIIATGLAIPFPAILHKKEKDQFYDHRSCN